MRLCVAIPCFFGKNDFCMSIRTCAELGYNAVETYNWQELDLKSVKRTLNDTGVELLSMCTTEFRLNSQKYRNLWLEGLKKTCEAANFLGVKKLITQVGNDTGENRKKQHESIIKGLILGSEVLEKHGITVMIEPLNTYINHPGYYLWSSSEAFDIVKEVNHPNVKVIYDIYHQQVMEGNIIPSVTHNLDLIAHLHGAGHPGRHEMQFGESDYSNIISAIDMAGYNGALGLEYSPTLDPIESLKEAKRIYG